MTESTDQQPPTAAAGPFALFRFAGGRFDSHTIPLEVLPDLAAYRKLIVEVAKVLFKQRMGNRVRVPKGFEDSFQIGLSRVEGGSSAVAVMPRIPLANLDGPQQSLAHAANQPNYFAPEHPEFDLARDYVDNVISVVRDTGRVPAAFPVELAGFFNAFGQSLRNDEFIEMGFGGATPVRYDTAIRKTIVLSREPIYENTVDADFLLDGGAVEDGLIHVIDSDGKSHDFRPVSDYEFNKAYSRAKAVVRLVGTGLYDKADRLKRLLNVNIVYDDGGATQPFHERLEEISSTPEGWYDGENPAPTGASIAAMRDFLEMVCMLPIPMPYLYPTPEGGIVAEWSVGSWEASAEIDLDGSVLTLNAVNADSLEEIDRAMAISTPDLRGEFDAFMKHVLVGD